MKNRDLVETARFLGDGEFYLHLWRHPTMKRFLTLFALPLVLVACETQPVGVDTPDAQFAKGDNPNKPDKPPKPVGSELITFEGDLIGSMEVAGCCPNAGPFPAYTMTLESPPFPAGISGVPQTGNIFMNSAGRKAQWDYVVQFWWGDEPDNYFIEIKGGEKEYDKRTKILTVDFADEEMTIIHADEDPTVVDVTFTLTRAPIG